MTEEMGNKEEKTKYTYTIKSGDTLSEIALDKGVSVEDLKEWNDLSSSLIFTGDELKIKDSGDNSEQTEEKSEDQTSVDSEKAEKEAEEQTEYEAEEQQEKKEEEEQSEKEAKEKTEKEAEEEDEKEA